MDSINLDSVALGAKETWISTSLQSWATQAGSNV